MRRAERSCVRERGQGERTAEPQGPALRVDLEHPDTGARRRQRAAALANLANDAGVVRLADADRILGADLVRLVDRVRARDLRYLRPELIARHALGHRRSEALLCGGGHGTERRSICAANHRRHLADEALFVVTALLGHRLPASGHGHEVRHRWRERGARLLGRRYARVHRGELLFARLMELAELRGLLRLERHRELQIPANTPLLRAEIAGIRTGRCVDIVDAERRPPAALDEHLRRYGRRRTEKRQP
jgi:hypothetical protein